jgi:predicted nucleic acid-binding Zn ribbon protein
MARPSDSQPHPDNLKCGEPRSQSVILETVQRQIELACEGDEVELKKTYTASGIKDKYTEYWINDILSQFKKETERGASKDTTTAALKQWVKDNNNDIYSPFLTTDGTYAALFYDASQRRKFQALILLATHRLSFYIQYYSVY